MKKIYPSGYPNMQKSRLYLVSILNKKYNYFLRYFSYFLVKVGVWSKVKRSKSKSNLAYAGVITPGVQNMQRVRSHHFPVLSLLVPKVILFKFQPTCFKFGCFSGCHVRTLDKNRFYFPTQNSILHPQTPILTKLDEEQRRQCVIFFSLYVVFWPI